MSIFAKKLFKNVNYLILFRVLVEDFLNLCMMAQLSMNIMTMGIIQVVISQLLQGDAVLPSKPTDLRQGKDVVNGAEERPTDVAQFRCVGRLRHRAEVIHIDLQRFYEATWSLLLLLACPSGRRQHPVLQRPHTGRQPHPTPFLTPRKSNPEIPSIPSELWRAQPGPRPVVLVPVPGAGREQSSIPLLAGQTFAKTRP